MKINSTKFGEIEYEESAVITFSDGLLGFGANKKFLMLNAEENSPFKWLLNVEDPELAFLVIDPYLFEPDYDFALSKDDSNELGITVKEDYVVLVIVVVQEDPTKSTANLLGPIILNIKNQKAKQLVLNNTKYTTKHSLMK
ncbi:flagellar assembly protein FliW [Thermodesulfobacteriota bacterium]